MLKYVILVLTFVCFVTCNDSVCNNNHEPVKLFADPKDPHSYHSCKYGTDMGKVTCANSEVFDQNLQTCIQPEIHDKACPEGKADGKYEYPGNPHMFIFCFHGKGFVFTCPTNLVWSESSQVCVDNVDNKTWAP